MKSIGHLYSLMAAGAAVLTVSCFGSAWSAGKFDGQYRTTLQCPRGTDGSWPWTYSTTASVRDGVLHLETTDAAQGTHMLDGKIDENGKGYLRAHGTVGSSPYAIHRAPHGTPYAWPVTADFNKGTGFWQNKWRRCDFTFIKQ